MIKEFAIFLVSPVFKVLCGSGGGANTKGKSCRGHSAHGTRLGVEESQPQTRARGREAVARFHQLVIQWGGASLPSSLRTVIHKSGFIMFKVTIISSG